MSNRGEDTGNAGILGKLIEKKKKTNKGIQLNMKHIVLKRNFKIK